MIRLGLTIVEAAMLPPLRAAAGRAAWTVAALVTVYTFALSAIGCALAALWIVVQPQWGPAGAALSVAGVLLAMCGLIAGVLLYRPRRVVPAAAPVEPSAVLVGQITRLLKEHKGATLAAAVLAGFVAARAEK